MIRLFSIANLEDKTFVLIDKNGENLNLPVAGLKPNEPSGPGLPMDKDLRITIHGEEDLFGIYDLRSNEKVTDLEYSYIYSAFFNHLTVAIDKKNNLIIIDDLGNIKCNLSEKYDNLYDDIKDDSFLNPVLFLDTILLPRKNKSPIIVDYEGKALKDLSDLNIQKITILGKGKGAENFLSYINNDGKHGIMDLYGNVALEPNYDEIISIGDSDNGTEC